MPFIDYIIQPGDTLAGIADKFQTTIPAITKLNSIIDPDKISAGQILRIAPPGYLGPTMQKYYRIQRGDTLTRIAKQFGTTVKALTELNDMNESDCLSIGQIIRIP